MNLRTDIAIFVVMALFSRCNLGHERLKDQFDSVNKSLQQSNQQLMEPMSLSATYDDIRLNTDRNPALAARADTIYQRTNEAISFMDRIKASLHKQDRGGEATVPADRLLVRTKTADSLRMKLIALAAVDTALHLDQAISNDSNWSIRYFRNTPTVAAITILEKFESDCRHSGLTTLTRIDGRL